MIPRNRWGTPWTRAPEIPTITGRNLRPVRAPVQQQLAVFLWISTSYPCWFRRPAHRAMMDRTFDRILREESHE